jgi:hypothetical protein
MAWQMVANENQWMWQAVHNSRENTLRSTVVYIVNWIKELMMDPMGGLEEDFQIPNHL